MNVTNLIIAVAIAVMAIAIVILSVRVKVTEESLDEIDVDKLNARIDQMDKDLDRCELQLNDDAEDPEIKEILEKMKKITDDIERIDQQRVIDHADLVDIRERYILWRDPVK